MQIKKILLASSLCAALILTGCASPKSMSDRGFDISCIDPFIKLNETTLEQLRAYLGTPTLIAVAEEDGHTIVGYGLTGHSRWGSYGRAMGKNALTLGLGSKSYEYTVKTVLFKLDADNKVIDYKKTGVSYVTKKRFTLWNECERKLTQQEINSPANYGVDEICQIYAEEVAAKKGIPVSEVDTGQEFEHCNWKCQTARGAVEVFGKIKDENLYVEALESDGSMRDLVWK